MFNVLALISVLVDMLTMKTLVAILPSSLAAAIWWKESINIESSVKLGRDRDLSALVMVLPFCLTVFRFRLYDPSFISGMADAARLWMIIGIFLIYVLVRRVAVMLVRSRRMPAKIYAAADKSANTFFILLTLALLAVGGIASFAGVSQEDVRIVLLWLSALIYGLYLIRKLQIFATSCNIFTAFLYLCALEILTTGIVVVSDVIF